MVSAALPLPRHLAAVLMCLLVEKARGISHQRVARVEAALSAQQRRDDGQDGEDSEQSSSQSLGAEWSEDAAAQEPPQDGAYPGVERLVPQIYGKPQTEEVDLRNAAGYLRDLADGDQPVAADRVRVRNRGEKVTISIHEPADPYAHGHSRSSEDSRSHRYPNDRAGPDFDRAASSLRHHPSKNYEQSSMRAGDLTDQLHKQAGIVAGATDDLAQNQERLRNLHGSAYELDNEYRNQHREALDLNRHYNARIHEETNAGRRRDALKNRLDVAGQQYKDADDVYLQKLAERQALQALRNDKAMADQAIGLERKDAIQRWKAESDNVRTRDLELQKDIRQLDHLNSHLRRVERGFESASVDYGSSLKTRLLAGLMFVFVHALCM